MSTNLVD